MTKVGVVHLNGCDRCAYQLIALPHCVTAEVVAHPLLKGKDDLKSADIILVTGYARKSDEKQLKEIAKMGKKIIFYGTCPYSGGIFGLLNQKGGDVVPATRFITPDEMVLGCPPQPVDLEPIIYGKTVAHVPLCKECTRKFTDDKMPAVLRVPDWSEQETCFNNLGLPCSGAISSRCSQKCIDFNTPCRGCVDMVDDPPGRMIGYFGSLATQIDVDTVATEWTTDRLGDRPDELTRALVDVVGTFFRFHLASHFAHPGRNPSTGDTLSDIMVARPIEEAPQIAATIYGRYAISAALNLIEAYEQATGIEVSKETKELRTALRDVQKQLLETLKDPAVDTVRKVIEDIRGLAGNEVLSNVYFGGFKTPVKVAKSSFDTYRVGEFEIKSVKASAEDEFTKVAFTTDEDGIIREWSYELQAA